jgi:hypothetical protein
MTPKQRKSAERKFKDKKIVVIKLKLLHTKGNKKEDQFTESSGLIALASNLGTGTFHWGFLSVPVPSTLVC